MVCAEKLQRQWVGIDLIEQAAVEIKKRMIKLAIDRGENELAIWDTVVCRDLRKSNAGMVRTEFGKLPPYRTHKKRLFGEQEGRCGFAKHGGGGCGHEFEYRNLTVDHIVPTIKGGTHHYSNLQLLCGACNSLKGAHPQAFLEMQLKKQGITLH